RGFDGELHGRGSVAVLVLVLAEIKFRLELRGHLDDRRKRKSLLAAETLQRPDDALADELLDFSNLQLPARHDFPQREVAFLALEFFVIFLNLPAAFRARNFERAVIAGHGVAFVALGL